MSDPLADLLALPESEQQSRGLSHTPREIFQQPETWLSTLDRMTAARPQLLDFLEDFLRAENGLQPEILLTGAGTSDYIGRAMAGLLRSRLGCGVSAVASTTLLTELDNYIQPGKKYLLVSFSRSGDSSEGVAVLRHALEQYPDRIRHLVVTCNPKGSMAKAPSVFTLLLDPRTNDHGLAMTSSFSNMVLAGQSLGFAREPGAFAHGVKLLAAAVAGKMPEIAVTTAALAARGFSRVCFLGTGALEAVAEESALKVLELNAGLIPTLSETSLGLRHGPLSFVDEGTLVVAYLSANSARHQYELDLLREMRTKNLSAEILIVAPNTDDSIRTITSQVVSLDASEDLPEWTLPAAYIVVGQLLALFCCIENGITPDSPSTGAITRVVSHVKIYPPTAPSLAVGNQSK